MLMLVAGLPVEIWPVQSEAMTASWEPWAALVSRPSRTSPSLSRFADREVPARAPPVAKGACVLRNLKLLVTVGAAPYAGRVIEAPLMSVAPQTGRTQPPGVRTGIR